MRRNAIKNQGRVILRKELVSLKWSLSELARRTKIHKSVISRILAGQRLPTLRQAAAICAVVPKATPDLWTLA